MNSELKERLTYIPIIGGFFQKRPDGQLSRRDGPLSRRDFLKVAGIAAGTVAETMLLGGCNPKQEQLLYGEPKIINRQLFGDYEIQTISPKSLRPKLNMNPFVSYPEEMIIDRVKKIKALDGMDKVIRIMKKDEEGNYKEVGLPGSLSAIDSINFFRLLFDIYHLGSYNLSDPDSKQAFDKVKADYFSTLIDKSISVEQRISSLSEYLDFERMDKDDVDAEDQNRKRLRDTINEQIVFLSGNNYLDIPDNAPWELILDSLLAARHISSDTALTLREVRQKTGTSLSMFIPKTEKDSVEAKAIEKLGGMFISVPDRPRVFLRRYKDDSADTEEKQKIYVYYGPDDKRNGDIDFTGRSIEEIQRLFNQEMTSDDRLIEKLIYTIPSTTLGLAELKPENLGFAFVPKPAKIEQGYIQPAIFFNDPDLRNSQYFPLIKDKTLELFSNFKNRLDEKNTSWVSDVTKAVNYFHAKGIISYFKYGLLPPKHAFARMFKGNGLSVAGYSLGNQALVPDDQVTNKLLALDRLALTNESVINKRLGVKIFQGFNDTYQPSVVGMIGISKEGEEASIEMPSGVPKLEAGAGVPVTEIKDIGNLLWVLLTENKTDPFLSEGKFIGGIGIKAEEILDQIMIMGNINEFKQTAETLAVVIPWTLFTIACFVAPESLALLTVSTVEEIVKKILTFIGAKIL